MTISTYLTEGISFLKRHNVPDPEISASLLLSYVLKQTVLSLKLNPEIKLTRDEEKQFESLLVKRATRYPIQYLMKTVPFRNATLEIGPGCLIPRPETEQLVDVVMERLETLAPLKILEIGTGSGNIAISLAMERLNWKLTATDLSEEALGYARKNSVLNNTSDQIFFLKADLFNGIEETFDTIVSNPPYVRTMDLMNAEAELSFEPAMALDGGEDGVGFYRRMTKNIKSVLKPGGFIFFEIGHDQARPISDLMKQEFEDIEIINDYAGHERIISGRLAGVPQLNLSF